MCAVFQDNSQTFFLNLSLSLSCFCCRKSFEYEDVSRLTAQQGNEGNEDTHPNLHHAYSDDNIYEDIVCKSDASSVFEARVKSETLVGGCRLLDMQIDSFFGRVF